MKCFPEIVCLSTLGLHNYSLWTIWFIYFYFCMFVYFSLSLWLYMHTHFMEYMWESEDNFHELLLSFNHLSSRNSAQVFSIVGRCLNQWVNLVGSSMCSPSWPQTCDCSVSSSSSHLQESSMTAHYSLYYSLLILYSTLLRKIFVQLFMWKVSECFATCEGGNLEGHQFYHLSISMKFNRYI